MKRLGKIHFFGTIQSVTRYHSLCRRWYTDVENTTGDVCKVTCKDCLTILAYRAGLIKGTSPGIISDKLKEMES